VPAGARLIVAFDELPDPTLAEVGGKGLSLIKMARAGLAIPPGFVLTSSFFDPWLATLQRHRAWRDFVAASTADELKARGLELKTLADDLGFDDASRAAIAKGLSPFATDALFAVRSSSPEEDLEGSSFAGGYETVLGVAKTGIEVAVRHAFASCLDARVAIYKQAHGFDWRAPRIAVVVQTQIASEIAGVGFSLNPISNAYDEAVFSANWGLGETVVAGLASPDLYTVDKTSRTIATRRLGKKEASIWLMAGGGTEERTDPRHAQLTLSDPQVLELTEQIVRIEELYRKPMDIEWAIASGRLYLLQARPVTTHLALPEDLVTPPGEKKRLYWDITISVQGLFQPLSPMGSSFVAKMLGHVSRYVFARDITGDLATTVPFARHGRILANMSNVLAFAERDPLARFLAAIDPQFARTMASLDAEAYRAPPPAKPIPWNLLWRVPEKLALIFEARLLPEHARRSCDRAIAQYLLWLDVFQGKDLAIGELVETVLQRTVSLMFGEVLPLLAMSKLAMGRIRGIFEDPTEEETRLLSRLDQSLPGNVTVEMGLALADLAGHLPAGRGVTVEELEAALSSGAAEATVTSNPAGSDLAELARAWTSFIAKYGHRGAMELDIASPRYRDQPRLLLAQVAQLSGAANDTEHSPSAFYERSQRERHEAFERLAERAHAKGWIASKRFQTLYRVVESLGGYRETPKFFLIYAQDVIRRRVLREAERLVAEGRLDSPQQVFDLALEDLEEALAPSADPALDLRKRGRERRVVIDRLARYPELPKCFDSRGRFLIPPPLPLREGELGGDPISAGIARGRVKVLHTPDEKPLHRGEILVARATDPGWTPLFVNAAAVILEVGGVMQHGALVAREYGKPCVAGVEGATRRLKDGALVEVDGAAGVVRLIPE
jgi:rifampicin phosphotransferase